MKQDMKPLDKISYEEKLWIALNDIVTSLEQEAPLEVLWREVGQAKFVLKSFHRFSQNKHLDTL